MQVLLEDRPLEGLYYRNVYVHQLVFEFTTPSNNFSVVNPSIRMSWIINNWEEEWSDKAANTIKELVSIVSEFVR